MLEPSYGPDTKTHGAPLLPLFVALWQAAQVRKSPHSLGITGKAPFITPELEPFGMVFMTCLQSLLRKQCPG